MKYKVIIASSISSLEDKVNNAMFEERGCSGNLIIIVISYRNPIETIKTCYQPVIKGA